MAETSQSPQQDDLSAISQGRTSKTTSIITQAIIYLTIPALPILLPHTMLAILPVVLLPTVVMYLCYHKLTSQATRVKGSKLLAIYLFSGIMGTVAVVAYQTVLSIPTGMVLFGSDFESYMQEFYRSETELEHADPELLAKRAQMASRPEYWIFLFIMCFDIIAFSEEMLKYLSIPLAMRYLMQATPATPSEDADADADADVDAHAHADVRQSLLDASNPLEKAYIPITITAALGFSTIENLGFVYGASTSEPALRLLQTVLERLIFAAPAHFFSAAYIGVMSVARDFRHDRVASQTGRESWLKTRLSRWMRVLTLPLLFHGTFDFLLLGVSAWDGNVGWVHPRSGGSLWFAVVGVLGLSMSLLVIVWRQWVRYGISL